MNLASILFMSLTFKICCQSALMQILMLYWSTVSCTVWHFRPSHSHEGRVDLSDAYNLDTKSSTTMPIFISRPTTVGSSDLLSAFKTSLAV